MAQYCLRMFNEPEMTNRFVANLIQHNKDERLYVISAADLPFDLESVSWDTHRLQIYPASKEKTFYSFESNKQVMSVYCHVAATNEIVFCGSVTAHDVYLYFTPRPQTRTIVVLVADTTLENACDLIKDCVV